MLYTISDTHLSLGGSKPMDIFGAGWSNHATRLEENWLKTVTCDDTVVIPGDISWGMTLDEAKEDLMFLNSLPGRKIIGKGNHDYWWDTASKLNAFKEKNGLDTIDFLHNNALYAQGKIICGTRGWTCEDGLGSEDKKLVERETLRLKLSLDQGKELKKIHPDSEMLVFMHFPVATPFAVHRGMMDILLEYGVNRVYYGHLHSVHDQNKICRSMCGIMLYLVSSDFLEFKPIKID